MVDALVHTLKCLDRYTSMLFSHPRDGKWWRPLRGIIATDNQTHLKQMRREITRCYTGIEKRVVAQLLTSPTPLLISVQSLVNEASPTHEEVELVTEQAELLADEFECCAGRPGGQSFSQAVTRQIG